MPRHFPLTTCGTWTARLLTACCGVGCFFVADKAWSAPPTRPGSDVNEIQRRAASAVAADPLLAGAWLDVDRDDDATVRGESPRVIFTRVLDTAFAERQAASLDRVIAALVPSGQFRIDRERDVLLPVSDLKSALEQLIAGDVVRFDGCQLLTVDLKRNNVDGRIVVVPRFRIVRPGQFPALVAECSRIMDQQPAWAAAEAAAIDTDPAQADLVPEPPTPDPNEVLARVVEAVRTTRGLQGAWLTLDTDDQGHPDVAARLIVFQRTLDPSRVPEQSAAIESLVRSLVPAGRYRVDTQSDRRLPLSKLLGELRRIIDMNPTFGGCAIESATYVPARSRSEQQFDLLLQGRIFKPEQVELICDLCEGLMSCDPAWAAAGVGVSVESTKTLATVLPDAGVATFHYSDAMHRFWVRDYQGADQRLALASLEDPSNIVYRYWRVIGELASGDESGAEERLRWTMTGLGVRQRSSEYVEVLRSIYRIQGPLRMALIAAERKVMTEATLGRPAATASAL